MQNTGENKKTVSRIFSVLKGKKRYLFILLFMQMCMAASSVGYALLLKNIIDAAVSGNKQILINNVIGLALLAVFQFVLRLLINYTCEYTKSTVENVFKKKLYSEILKKEYSFVMQKHSGEWLNRITNDTVVVANGITEIIPGFASMAVRMCVAFVFLLHFIPKFTVFILICGVVLIIFTVLFRKISKKLHNEVQASDGKLRVFLTEQFNALMILKAYSEEYNSLNFAENYMDDHKKKRLRKNIFTNFCSSGCGLAFNVMQLLGALYAGLEILSGNISYGTFAAIMQLMGQIYTPIANISGYLPRYYSMLASSERIFEITEYPEDISENAILQKNFYSEKLIEFGLKNATFSYKMSNGTVKPVFNNININIKKGHFIAFMGNSGCGKSTVLKILLSLYKLDDGISYINTDCGVIPITSSYRGLFAYVPQGNLLMNATIKDVITFGNSKIDFERFNNALKIACADSFVNNLKSGINTHLGERGSGLSEGEMQRIAIARAIYSDRPVLLLDEATSALDETTEKQLLKNLKTMTDKTVIIVTHRKGVTEYVDTVLKFNEGGILSE